MIEPIMYLAIGFLISMLCGLGILPLVHNRAVRLTTRRLEAATPVSMAEIQADKDQLRAEYAMSARRLELSLEQLKSKTTSQLAEIGKKTDAVNRLKNELAEKNAAIFDQEAREKSLQDKLQAIEAEVRAKTEALRDSELALADKREELTKVQAELAKRSTLADSRQVELVAARTQIESLTDQIGDAKKEHTATQALLAEERAKSEFISRELNEAREQAGKLGQRVDELDRQLADRAKEVEAVSARTTELEGQLATQGKLLAAREGENRDLRQAQDKTAQPAGAPREVVAGDAAFPALQKLRDEKAQLERELRAAADERAALKRELGNVQQQGEGAWATDRMENALLRDRINDIAAEVANLAMRIEGPNSTIADILAQASPKAARGQNGAANGVSGSGEGGGTLADRIRALQAQASKARQPGA